MEEINAIAESILGRKDIRPDQDLFDQGATSLAYVRIIAEINQRYELSLNGSEVDGVATIDRLAQVVRAAAPSAMASNA
jgi:acyl carrier protein